MACPGMPPTFCFMNPVRRSRHALASGQQQSKLFCDRRYHQRAKPAKRKPLRRTAGHVPPRAVKHIGSLCQHQDSPVQMAADVEETKFSETPDISLELGASLVQDVS